MPVSRMDVFRGYQVILGRLPESESAVEAHMGHHDLWQLVEVLASSPERASAKLISKDTFPFVPLNHPANTVEVSGSPAELDALWDRVKAAWESLGAAHPHFSVLTQPEFLPAAFQHNEAEFWRSGEAESAQTMDMLDRYGFGDRDRKIGFEFGAGVGRLSIPLSENFQRLIACDISRPHLDIAERRVRDLGRDNIDFVHMASREALQIPKCDFFYTRIVLQHNPPPIMKEIIERALAALNPGGMALLQLPTYQVGYAFRLQDYLARPQSRDMEMHALPQNVVLDLVRDADCELVEVREDNDPHRPDLFISNTFAVRKRSRR